MNRLSDSRYGLAVVLLVFSLCWVLVPLAFYTSLPTDVAEELAWGREWQVGIYRHPPMAVWLLEIAYQLTGHWTKVCYLVSVVAFSATQLLFFVTAKDVFDRRTGFAAVVLSMTVPYFSFHLFQWNANIVQFPFAALLLFAGWRAIVRDSLGYWLLAGVAAAGGVLSKYSFAAIPFAAFLCLVADHWFRTRVRWSHVLLAAALGTLLVLPNLIWLDNHFPAAWSWIARIKQRGGENPYVHLLAPFFVWGVALGVLLLVAIPAWFGMDGRAHERDPLLARQFTRLLSSMLLVPLVAVSIGVTISGTEIKDLWLSGYLIYAPLWVLAAIASVRRAGPLAWKRSGAIFVAAVVFGTMIALPVDRQLKYWRAPNGALGWYPLMQAASLAGAVEDVLEIGSPEPRPAG